MKNADAIYLFVCVRTIVRDYWIHEQLDFFNCKLFLIFCIFKIELIGMGIYIQKQSYNKEWEG